MDESLHHQFAEIEGRHWWFQGRRRVVTSVLRRRLGTVEGGPGLRILDLGCGTGEMVDMLRAFGTVSAIDPSPGAVRSCRERFGDEVDVAVGRVPDDLPPPGTVDVVTAFDVLEHLDDDADALRHFYRILPEGGALFVTVPAFQALWGPHDVLSHHRRRYTRPQLRALLEDAGFTVELATYFNTWLFPVVAAVRLLRRRRPGGTAASDFSMPPPAVNRLLEAVLASEGALLAVAPLPVGVSLLAVARRAPAPGPA